MRSVQFYSEFVSTHLASRFYHKKGVEHGECLSNRHSCQPLSEAQPLAIAGVGGSIAKLTREDVRKLRVTRRHRTYLDCMSDGFGELLLDLFERNLGPSIVMESA